MLNDAHTEAARVLSRSNDCSEEEAAREIKKFFDHKFVSIYVHIYFRYEPNWHCVVGKNFASFFTSEAKTYCFFYHGQVAILLYKLGC